MVSRTRIPTAMFPVGGSETDPVPRTNTPSAMTRDGSGEPQNEEMIQDYPCGEETGHYFISSPLNVYSIGRSGAVVLYVEGGCPDFTWTSDNAWATFSSATTSARYNTLESGADEGQDTVVTVIQTALAEIRDYPWPGEVVLFIDGGCPPFDWTVSGTGLTLDYVATNSRRNRLHGASGVSCGAVTVEDLCAASVSWCWSPDFSYIAEQHTKIASSMDLTVEKGVPDIVWEFVGSATGWTIQTSPTSDLDTVLSPPYTSEDEIVTVKATDACGNEVSKDFMLSCDPIYGGQSLATHGTYVASYGSDICQISDDLFASVHGYGGVLRTFTINLTTGEISDVIDSATFAGGATVVSPRIVHVFGGMVAIAFGGGDGRIVTHSIQTGTGAIGAQVESAQFYNAEVKTLDFISVGGGLYCVAYSRADSGYLTGASVDAAGAIDTNFEDGNSFTEQFHDTRLRSISMCYVGGDYAHDTALAFVGYDSHEGKIQTWTVHTSATLVDSVTFSADGAMAADVVKISYDNIGYVLAWEAILNGGYLQVYSRDEDNGTLTLEATRAMTSYFAHPSIVNMQEDCFFIVYPYSIHYNFHTVLIDTWGDYAIRNMTYRRSNRRPYGSDLQVVRCSDSVAAAVCGFYYVGGSYDFGVYSQRFYCNTY